MPDLVRELFIGLGGTGGNALKLLYQRMTDEQRRTAKYVFIDLDQKDTDRMEVEGIRSIRISNADTVLQVAQSLGNDDGVMDWLPRGSNERLFLNSRLDDGASQCRFKSRLCLARFIKNGAPGLREILEEMSRPGAALQQRLRIVLVASIAGGTGAGTFIQMALYIRKFFRSLNQQAEIVGILSLPDLYAGLAKNDVERVSMYANAYAAIRELNAMNLATNPQPGNEDGGLHATNLQGYGMNINIRVGTRSEGLLFDSKDPSFFNDANAKPFDLIYFVDKANESGGILRNINEYYRVMADIAYTRLYSPMNASIASGESNELRNHTMVPTAIYGSAGYSSIIYPYRDILHYISETKLSDELGDQWLYFDSLWEEECRREREAAKAYGGKWSPKPGQRGRKYRDDLDAALNGENSKFKFLENMIYGRGNTHKVEQFKNGLNAAAASLKSDSSGKSTLPDDPEDLRSFSGGFSVLHSSDVVDMVKQMMKIASTRTDSSRDTDSDAGPYSALFGALAKTENLWPGFVASLEAAVKSQAQKLADAVLPLSDEALGNHDKTSPISLHHGLLSVEGKGDVHPLAARYLLYGVQAQCIEQGSADKNALRSALEKCIKNIRLALDEDKDDGEDITVQDAVNESMRQRRAKNREADAEHFLRLFCEELRTDLAHAIVLADRAVVRTAYGILKKPVDELVSLYEDFFAEIKPYREELQRRIFSDRVRHDSGSNQTIYVGASSGTKDFYCVDQTVAGALTADDEVYAATGSGVYENLYARMRKRISEKARLMSQGEGAPAQQQEQFRNMGSIFDNVLTKYAELLDRNSTVLKTNAVGALINEICAELNVSKAEIESDIRVRQLFERSFRRRIEDLRAKARPMIRYNETNNQNYFLEETEDVVLNVSKTYCNFGISPAASEIIRSYFHGGNTNHIAFFHSRMNLPAGDDILVNEEFDDNEIFCFSAVHCLQPTQIYHFLEDQQEGSYYGSYRERISTGRDSDSPHLDKRWNPRGSMPYISANLELKWRRTVMKALLYESVNRHLKFTVMKNNARRFMRKEGNSLSYLTSTNDQPILVRDISRLVEYLADDEERIEYEAERLDELVKRLIRELYNYAETVGTYKQGMTKSKMLTRLRGNMITFIQTDRSVRSDKTFCLDEGEAAISSETTLGGVLHVAYLLHTSEERLGEDKDYGEALLEAALEIIDSFAMGMHGTSGAAANGELNRQYVEIYNWTVDKFMSAWLSYANAELFPGSGEAKRETAPAVPQTDDDDLDDDGISVAPQSGMQGSVLSSPEYIWITSNWKHKSFQDT